MADKMNKLDRKARKLVYRFGSRKLNLLKPTKGYPTEEEAAKKFDANLELFYAHGYNGKSPESRQNLYVSNDGNYLVYYLAAVVVVFDYKANTQKFFTHHNDDITALCLDRRDGSTLVASGQTDPIDRPGEGKDLPKVWIWDMKDMSKVELVDKICWGYISKIAWSTKTGHIYILCGDDDQTLKVFNIEDLKKKDYKRIEKKKGKKLKKAANKKEKEKQEACNYAKECLLECNTMKEKISGMVANTNPSDANVDELLVYGKRKFCYMKIVKGDKGKLKASLKSVSIVKLFKAGEKSFGCATFLNDGYYVVGGNSGQLYIGKESLPICLIQTAHLKPVGCLYYKDEKLYSGGFDKKFVTWDVLKDLDSFKGKKGKECGLKKVDTREIKIQDSDMVFHPKAIDYNKASNTFFVGTKSNHIVQIEEKGDPKVIMDGHDGQVWGLATHPSKDLFITGGYDNVVKLWDANKLECIQTHEFKLGKKVKGKSKSGKEVVTAAWSSNGKYIAFGTEDSNIAFFTFDDKTNKFKYVSMTKIPRKTKNAEEENVSYIRFSGNSKLMGVAHMDSNLYIFTIKSKDGEISLDGWKPLGHTAAPTHVQWSSDSKIVKTLTRDYEVVHWKLLLKKKKGSHIPNVPDPDDVKWVDDPLPAGWDVQGLYQPEFDGTDLNDCTLTADNKFIVSGDDFGTIRMHPYPAINQNNFKEYHGHAEFVVGVEMLRSGKQMISCGGADMAIFQWKANGVGEAVVDDDDAKDEK